MNALLHHCRREHSQLNVQAFPCHLANIVPKDSKCSHYCVLILIIIVIISSGLADSEEGLVVLQTMVEGMVLEAHVSSGNATEPSPVHLVELYSQYGSQVCVCVCVRAHVRVCEREVVLTSFCRRPYLSTESWWTRVSLFGRRTPFNPVITIHCLLIF